MYYYSKNDDLGIFKGEKYKIEIEVYILNTSRPFIAGQFIQTDLHDAKNACFKILCCHYLDAYCLLLDHALRISAVCFYFLFVCTLVYCELNL